MTICLKPRVRRRGFLAAGVVLLALAFAAPLSGAVDCAGYVGEKAEAAAFWRAVSEGGLRACIAAHGVDIEGETYGGTPLHWAARYAAHPAAIAALIEAGADIEARDDGEWTPLHFAVASKNPDAVAALLEAGANVGARDRYEATPLYRAAMFDGSLAVAMALIEAGADPMAREDHGFTPLHAAAMHASDPAVAMALIDVGADPMARADAGFTPLHAAAMRASDPTVALALIDVGADPMARADEGFTPLHVAATHATDPAVAMALLNAGADPMARNDEGDTVWDLAQANDALRGTMFHERLRALASVESGADTDVPEVGAELWLAPLVWSQIELVPGGAGGFPFVGEEADAALSILALARDRAMAALAEAALEGDEPGQARNVVSVYVIDVALSSLCRRTAGSVDARAPCDPPGENEIQFRDLADAVGAEVVRLLTTEDLNLGRHLLDLPETKAHEIGGMLGWDRDTTFDLRFKLLADLSLMLLKLDMARELRFWDIDFNAVFGYELVDDETCLVEAKAIGRALTQMRCRSYILYVDDRVPLEWDNVCRNPYWSWMDKTVLWHLHPIVFDDPCRGPDSDVESAIVESAGGMMSSVSDAGETDEAVAAWLTALWSDGGDAAVETVAARLAALRSDGGNAVVGPIERVYDRLIEGAADKCPS